MRFGVCRLKIAAVVTDTAENMKGMRKRLQETENVVEYGCSVLFIGGENVKFYDEFKKIGDVKITNFVKAQVLLGNLSEKLGNISEQLMAMVPSSAGLERIFSSMGYIHSEIRNRLDPEKVRKLAFCMRLLS